MKTLIFILGISSLLTALQYQKGKIDMHGGEFDNYNSIGGYKDGRIRKIPFGMSQFLDKNSTKSIQKKSTKDTLPLYK